MQNVSPCLHLIKALFFKSTSSVFRLSTCLEHCLEHLPKLKQKVSPGRHFPSTSVPKLFGLKELRLGLQFLEHLPVCIQNTSPTLHLITGLVFKRFDPMVVNESLPMQDLEHLPVPMQKTSPNLHLIASPFLLSPLLSLELSFGSHLLSHLPVARQNVSPRLQVCKLVSIREPFFIADFLKSSLELRFLEHTPVSIQNCSPFRQIDEAIFFNMSLSLFPSEHVYSQVPVERQKVLPESQDFPNDVVPEF